MQQLTQGGSDLDLLRAEVRALRQELTQTRPPVSPTREFLPEELRTLLGPTVALRVGKTVVTCVRLDYNGQVLYRHATEPLLLWEAAPGRYRRVESAQQLAQLAPVSYLARPRLAPEESISLG